MQSITIMGHFLEEFKEVGSLECPSCCEIGVCGFGIRTKFQLLHPNGSNRYEFMLIANEYHICSQCHRAYFFRVDVIKNEPLDF